MTETPDLTHVKLKHICFLAECCFNSAAHMDKADDNITVKWICKIHLTRSMLLLKLLRADKKYMQMEQDITTRNREQV